MKILKAHLALAVVCAMTMCPGTCQAQYQNAYGAGTANAAAANRGTAASSTMSAASAQTGAMGPGTVESSATGSAHASYDGASKWTAGASSFTETGSGAWAVNKGTFGGSRGASWTAGSQSFGEHVQMGGIWRVDPSVSPAGDVALSANSISASRAGAPGTKPSANGKAAQHGVQTDFSALPSGMTARFSKEHGYGHSATRLSAAGPHYPGKIGARRSGTLAAHSVSRSNSGFGRSYGMAKHGAGQDLTGMPDHSGLTTPNLTDPGLSDPLLNKSGPHDSLNSGMPQ